MRQYLIHTSLIYTNAPPHIGHLYELIAANSLCECFKNWYAAKLAIGADDHGAKIQNVSKLKAASAAKISNLNSNKLLALCSKYKINAKSWISTSYPRHINLVKKKLRAIKPHETTRKLDYCGWYSPQLDCYYSGNEVSFTTNLMYCIANVPTEWVQEQAVFLRVSRLKWKLLALFRAKLIRTPLISYNLVLESIKSLEDVCITRSKTANYGIKLTTGHLKLTLWVWIDAILAYLRNELAYKIHIIGKDVTKFHLTYYLALALLSNSKLPKSIVQHSHITTLETKVSKSLGNQLKSTSFRTTELYYYLSTRLPKHDIKLNESELAAAANKLINNVGNLAKRLTKLLKLNQPKLKWLTASDWILITYVRQLEAALKHLIKNFKVNEINNITLNGAAKINALISNYKLWQHARAGHKLFIYRFATKQYIKWLKHNIGGAATLINLNMQNANTNYTPFLRS